MPHSCLVVALLLVAPGASASATVPAHADTMAARQLLGQAAALVFEAAPEEGIPATLDAGIALRRWSAGDSVPVRATLTARRARLSGPGTPGYPGQLDAWLQLAHGLRHCGARALALDMAREASGLRGLGCDPAMLARVAALRYVCGDSAAALRLEKSSLGDSQFRERGHARLAHGVARFDGRLAWRLVAAHRDEPGTSAVLQEICLNRAAAGDWRTAERVAAQIEEATGLRPYCLARVAEAARQAGEREEFQRLVTETLRVRARPGLRGRAMDGLPPLVVSLMLDGQVARAESLLVGAGPYARRTALFARARYEEFAGWTARALATLDSASAQQPENRDAADDAHDQGFPDWIVAMADAGHDSAALGAAALLRDAGLSGSARGCVAAAQARRGNISAARRTLAGVTRSPGGVAEALVAISGAEARSGRLDRARECLAGLSGDLEAQCRGVDPASGEALSDGPCPPPDLVSGTRRRILAAVAGTPAGRAALPSLLEGAARRERIEILVAAARGYLEGED